MMPKFAVLGAGNVGRAMAAHLSLCGCDVNLYNRTDEKIAQIRKNGGIDVKGAISGFGKISLASSNIKKIIENADIIMVTVPASGHKFIANELSNCLNEEQIIVLNPGRTLGALEFHTIISKKCSINAIAETQTIIYTTRYCDNDVEIFALKNRISLAAIPATKTRNVIESLIDLYPQIVPGTNTLETGLGNVGSILHPSPTLLNMGWIENGKTPFKYYYEGITKNIAEFLDELDQERIDVAEALGIKVSSVKDWLFEAYGVKGDSLYESIHNNKSYQMIDAPTSINHRYIFEDIPTGLVPICSLGEHFNVPTPNMDLIVDLACKITHRNFWSCGRTLENLGLNDVSADQLLNIVTNGRSSI